LAQEQHDVILWELASPWQLTPSRSMLEPMTL
jgi:hypothetical protein